MLCITIPHRQDFVEEDLLSLFLLLRLAAFQHAVLVRPDQGDLAPFTQELAVKVQADSVAKAVVGVGEKVPVEDVVDEGVDIEDPLPVDLVKELGLGIDISEQLPHRGMVDHSGEVDHSGRDQFAFVGNEAGVSFEQVSQFVMKTFLHSGFLTQSLAFRQTSTTGLQHIRRLNIAIISRPYRPADSLSLQHFAYMNLGPLCQLRWG